MHYVIKHDVARDSGKKVIKENIRIPLEKTISEIDKNILEIRDTRSTRSETCRQLEVLQRECRYLIQKIHFGIWFLCGRYFDKWR